MKTKYILNSYLFGLFIALFLCINTTWASNYKYIIVRCAIIFSNNNIEPFTLEYALLRDTENNLIVMSNASFQLAGLEKITNNLVMQNTYAIKRIGFDIPYQGATLPIILTGDRYYRVTFPEEYSLGAGEIINAQEDAEATRTNKLWILTAKNAGIIERYSCTTEQFSQKKDELTMSKYLTNKYADLPFRAFTKRL